MATGIYEKGFNPWTFKTVRDFWLSDVNGRSPGANVHVNKDYGFWGKLSKGLTEDAGQLIGDQGDEGLCITVESVVNPDRTGNWTCCQNPPPRTGKFDRFMDEVEAVAREFNLRFVLVDKVDNTFLRKKFERRGYQRIDYQGVENPDYIKKYPI